MFEKEANDKKPPYAYCSFNTNCELWKDGFQKGAEFGYNKAKEDADKMKSQFLELCNLKDMRIAELEKANEWHKMKYNDKDSCSHIPAYIQLLTEYDCGLFVAYCVNKWTGDHWVDHTYGVTAWKEIVVPKESK